uniref:uncharacterized protein LOC122585426 n=1 Tax=Erigeron canadensis TaxID=72917 RepID=UPI001CB9A2B0|nr:uncharacterized protein LOC122585426 [Erigeron canadensis]
MLAYSKLPPNLWAEAVATACFTQNRSIINKRFEKTPYEFEPKGDEAYFIGRESIAYRAYNRRTKKIVESMNVRFDKLSSMVLEQNSSRPELNRPQASATITAFNVKSQFSTLITEDLDILFEEFYYGHPRVSEPGLDTNTVSSTMNTSSAPNGDDESSPSLNSDISSPSSNSHLHTATSELQGPHTHISQVTNPATNPEVYHTKDFVEPLTTSFEQVTAQHTPTFIDTDELNDPQDPLPHSTKWTRSHPISQIIGNPDSGIQTRSASVNEPIMS